jgi:hypothetical protein
MMLFSSDMLLWLEGTSRGRRKKDSRKGKLGAVFSSSPLALIMLANQGLVVVGERVVLVPYRLVYPLYIHSAPF